MGPSHLLVHCRSVNSERAQRGPVHRRVRQEAGGRQHRVTARYTAEEWALVEAAADAERRTPAGYVADAALVAARGESDSGPGSVREALRLLGVELMAVRVALNRVRQDVEQLAAVVTGSPVEDAAAVVALCRQATATLDEAMTYLRSQLHRRHRTVHAPAGSPAAGSGRSASQVTVDDASSTY